MQPRLNNPNNCRSRLHLPLDQPKEITNT
jgi:hypothetical protein